MYECNHPKISKTLYIKTMKGKAVVSFTLLTFSINNIISRKELQFIQVMNGKQFWRGNVRFHSTILKHNENLTVEILSNHILKILNYGNPKSTLTKNFLIKIFMYMLFYKKQLKSKRKKKNQSNFERSTIFSVIYDQFT